MYQPFSLISPPRSSSQPAWIEIPAYIVDTLWEIGATPANATKLFMHPSNGLRAINEIDQLVRFEFTSTYSSQSVRDVIFGVQPDMTKFEVIQLMRLNLHPMMGRDAHESSIPVRQR